MYNDIKYWAQLLKESEQEKTEYKEACEAFEAEDKKLDEAMPSQATINKVIEIIKRLLDSAMDGNDDEDVIAYMADIYEMLTSDSSYS